MSGRGLGVGLAAAVLLSGYAVLSRRYPRAAGPTPARVAAQETPPRPAPVIGRPAAPRRTVSDRPGPAPGRARAGSGLGFELVEASSAAGLLHGHTRMRLHPSLANVEPWLGAVGAGVAVADFDGDGWQDVFLTDFQTPSAPKALNRLYRNNRDGTFTDVAEGVGLWALNPPASLRPLFLDYDNDGDKDLLLTTALCTRLFRNEGGRAFTDVTRASGLDHCGVAYASNALDYDGDGDLDLVIADYIKPVDVMDPAHFKFMPNSMQSADNGGPAAVFENLGDGTFRRVPGALGLSTRGWTLAVGVHDLRSSGRPDLWLATDFNSDRVYLNEGGGRFADASDQVRHKHIKGGMNADGADIDNDGRTAVYVTNIYEPPYSPGENLLWKWGPDGPSDVAARRGASECGWGWGAKFLDLDLDGWQDLVVTNGFISAAPSRNYWYPLSVFSSGAGFVLEDARNWPPIGDSSISGYQRKCVYMNRRGRFRDVTDLTGMRDDRSDGRGLAAIDADNDGRLSLVEANQNQPVRFYRNRRANSNHWIGFRLEGRRSNRDAWGATIRVRLKGLTLTRYHQPANAFMSQSDGRVHFGLGQAPVLEGVDILWPSGRRQVLRGSALDRYHTVVEDADGGS